MLLILQYQLGPSKKHRPAHVQQAGKIYAVDDPFWQLWMPPNGYGCKCHVIAMTRRRAEREGGVSQAPAPVRAEVVNPRGGEIRPTVVGITPGFETNPGTQRQAHLQQLVTEKLERVGAPVGNAIIKQLLVERPFQQFLAQPQGFFPVAVMTPAAQAKLGTQAATVRFSAWTVGKQIDHHPELTPEDCAVLPDIIEHGELLDEVNGSPVKVMIIKQHGEWYRAVIKVTANRGEVYLQSFHHINEDKALRHFRRNKK